MLNKISSTHMEIKVKKSLMGRQISSGSTRFILRVWFLSLSFHHPKQLSRGNLWGINREFDLPIDSISAELKFKCRKTCILRKFSQNPLGYHKNPCTNTRLVCTHLNPFFLLNPNMVMKSWILNIFKQVWKVFLELLSAIKILMERLMPKCSG